jgi:Ca2+-binding EF-hand superfamily protein
MTDKVDKTLEDKAKKTYGEKMIDKLKSSFNERDKSGSGNIPYTDDMPKTLSWLLRSNGLCPTEAKVDYFVREVEQEGGLTFSMVLKFALDTPIRALDRNELLGAQADLEQFFEPFDPERKGKVSRKVFRNLMENVGEPFSRAEVDEMIAECECVEDDQVDYKLFLATIMEK